MSIDVNLLSMRISLSVSLAPKLYAPRIPLQGDYPFDCVCVCVCYAKRLFLLAIHKNTCAMCTLLINKDLRQARFPTVRSGFVRFGKCIENARYVCDFVLVH